MPRLVTEKEIIPQIDESVILKKLVEVDESAKIELNPDDAVTENNGEMERDDLEKEPINGTVMKVPPLLDESIPVSAAQCILKVLIQIFSN